MSEPCDYKIIAPPFTLRFKEMNKQELVAYNKWFLGQIPERIETLTAAVRCTPGFQDWQADYTPESLDRLGEWFAKQVETRKQTEEEKQEIYDRAPTWFRTVEISDWELTNRTFSLAMDIGMYLALVFLKNVPGLTWFHTTKGSKNWVDYGQPVLEGFKRFKGDVFNPVRMMVTLAYGLARGSRSSGGLRELYEIWKKFAEAAQP